MSREDIAYLRPDADATEAARSLLGGSGDRGPAVVLLTAGADEVVAFTPIGELRIAVRRVHLVDTVGAGDAFGGAFLAWWSRVGLGRAALADEPPLRAAIEAAVEVAAITCERMGADPPCLAELSPMWTSPNNT